MVAQDASHWQVRYDPHCCRWSCRGGRCYTQHVDGTERDWGHVLVWEPPNRFVFAWQITHAWENQSDLSRCSEVEVTFASLADRATRVEVEHRHFERHGDGSGAMRAAVDAPNGWTAVLAMFVARLNR